MEKWIFANWKSQGNLELITQFRDGLSVLYQNTTSSSENYGVICPPFPLIPLINQVLQSLPSVWTGAQDLSIFDEGSHTGDVSGALLKSLGCRYVIIGHSERRKDHHENNDLVLAKAQKALQNGLIPIICVGESLAEKQNRQTESVIRKQLQPLFQLKATLTTLITDTPKTSPQFFIAYEPIWSIGTNRTPSLEEIAYIMALIDKCFKQRACSLYGGAVTLQNYQDILSVPYISGVLVGRECLHPDRFVRMLQDK